MCMTEVVKPNPWQARLPKQIKPTSFKIIRIYRTADLCLAYKSLIVVLGPCRQLVLREQDFLPFEGVYRDLR